MTEPAEKQAFSVKSFCAAYDIGRTLAYDEMRAGRLPAVQVGRRTLIKKADADAWLNSLKARGRTRQAASQSCG